MLRQSNNVSTYVFGVESLSTIKDKLQERRDVSEFAGAVFLVDDYFKQSSLFQKFHILESDKIIWISTKEEPTTDNIDEYIKDIMNYLPKDKLPCAVVGIGGGCALDSAKAVSNLLGNGGRAEDYQGWDLVKRPGVYKIGVPTISGTGAEASRTCVLTNKKKNLKLGMNSAFTMFDHLILDPKLSETVNRDQYFYTAMDTYIHCVESLNGRYRHALADSFSIQAIQLIRDVCKSKDMMTLENREKVMVASYLGGASIANTYVGVVHPLSAGLSTVLHTHHCIGNCIVMNVMDEFYKEETQEFKSFLKMQNVNLPTGLTSKLNQDQFKLLYDSAIIHEKPLINALGDGFKTVLTLEKMTSLFRKM